jgi:amidohydrolase
MDITDSGLASGEVAKAFAEKHEDYAIKMRREFHMHPELPLKEKWTSQRVIKELDSMGIPYEIVGKYGIIATIKGAGPGKTVALRADMDALPVEEKIDKPYASKIKGVKHACGHDAHMAMLLGAAKSLLDIKEKLKGDVLLLFEQAEESGMGVDDILKGMEKRKVDGAFAIHVAAGLPTGRVSIKPGPVSAALHIFTVKVLGRGAHGSSPHLSIDPILISAEMITSLSAIQARELSPYDVATLVVGQISGGTRANIIPPDATFKGNVRFYDQKVGDKIEKSFKRIVNGIADAHQAKANIRYLKVAIPNVNDPESARIATMSGAKIIGEENVVQIQRLGAESFAKIADRYPSVYIHVGTANPEKGTDYDHHTQEFDVDEDGLKIGVAIATQYAIDFLGRK